MLIFQQHFSTQKEVTTLSGRGVGLSAVQSELAILNGSIQIESELDRKTQFTFKFPYME